MAYIAAIDIGSNALRLAIARITPEGLHLTYRSRAPVRLGSSVFGHGKIDKKTYQDLKQALLQFKNQLENHNVRNFRAIATSAMREASNSEDIVQKLLKATSIPIEVISGEEEARLVSLAISQKVSLETGSHLLIDIGGGSIELVALVDGQTVKKQSFVLGMVRILEMQKDKKKPLQQWLADHISSVVSDFFQDLPSLDTSIGTGGSMDRFGKLKSFVSSAEKISMSPDEMQKLYELLNEVGYKERIKKFFLKPDRADVIIPAAIATLVFLKLARSKEIIFPEVGIKDGVLQELSSGVEN